ncbi:MAG: adenylate/guanylate cyclase domain-containing protein [Deltaproteobacteria bacterium]|jgi:adenylate cyclase|nr:adenylate/guanylate cyclase domain-containing protein [Deltaproteobacteria bacterium]MBT4264334.1 adenylate/guanylate cyclase domain-containing protein [Deltaproteobacteria bacterium]MBT4642504.1 adenylate/guanylate cyclase domain-containing protein [Deltaproteobacteria bacterium]MBT6500894.1 adenylate/guanylate cyclase domain-containing protein [Deltaproteobacteria bacterium]MBT6614718.1 adenylate/guanylate cyclase domain-containing protein [Deltaproteobacteria bacterium]
MSYEIFDEEMEAIQRAEVFLESRNISSQVVEKAFKTLLKDYGKLFKSVKRLMRLSDRNEQKLKEVTTSLDEKNNMLEDLSGKLAKYLSPQVYELIFSGAKKVQLTTDRKKLTIFFSDIKDFTATTDDLEPEDITFLLNDYLTEMSEIALRYGATIDKFIGDAILIFFGDPATRGVREDAMACVQMAIEMQRHMMDIRTKWKEMGYTRPFHMRVGINTGFCNVGNFGSADRMDYTIIGGEVNLASRLEGVADPDGITLSHETYTLVNDFINAEKGESISVKGIRRKITPYKITGIFNDTNEERRFLRSDRNGIKIFVDFDKLDEESRSLAIDDMRAAIKRLSKLDEKTDNSE